MRGNTQVSLVWVKLGEQGRHTSMFDKGKVEGIHYSYSEFRVMRGNIHVCLVWAKLGEQGRHKYVW